VSGLKRYVTEGVCSKAIDVKVREDVVEEVIFLGGCNGSLQGISILIKGMKVGEAISKVTGIKCGSKETSCPDQLSKALKSYIKG
jgi:uncharacterized protein (TIGR03905 family)